MLEDVAIQFAPSPQAVSNSQAPETKIDQAGVNQRNSEAQQNRRGWQYTTWGMTPNEVKLASQGTASENYNRGLDSGGYRVRLVAPYTSGQLSFKAQFEFDEADHLRIVTLNYTGGGDCGPGVVFTLTSAYGPPQDRSETPNVVRIFKWWDNKSGNLVIFMEIGHGDSCSIKYSELPQAGRPGGL